MHLPGLLCFGSPEGDLIQGLGRCYAGTELAHERFDAAEAMRRFPQFRLPESDTCFWDPFGGYLFPEKCLRTHVQEAQLAGATLLQGEQVLALEDSRESVTVHTRNHTLGAARVVIASGAFTNRLLAAADSRPISAVRKVLFWYRMTDPGAFIPEKFPAWIGQQNGREFYGFPTLDRHGIKAAEDSGGQAVEDPALVKRDLLPEDEANLRPFLERTFGSQLQERLRHKTCLYEMTEDRHFIVDRHPAWENVTIAAGGSGHGYKFCSVIGEMAAQMAIDGRAPGRPEILAARGRL
jgi:sarcosine oxidase